MLAQVLKRSRSSRSRQGLGNDFFFFFLKGAGQLSSDFKRLICPGEVRDPAGEGWSTRGSKLTHKLLWNVAETPREMLSRDPVPSLSWGLLTLAFLRDRHLNSRLLEGTV